MAGALNTHTPSLALLSVDELVEIVRSSSSHGQLVDIVGNLLLQYAEKQHLEIMPDKRRRQTEEETALVLDQGTLRSLREHSQEEGIDQAEKCFSDSRRAAQGSRQSNFRIVLARRLLSHPLPPLRSSAVGKTASD